VLLAGICALFAGQTAAGAVECGQVLTEDTVLDTDLVCPGDGLVVGAERIVIDLGGHLVRGPYSPSELWYIPGTVGIRNDGHRDVEIRNGRIAFFEHGVSLTRAAGNQVEGLVLGRDLKGTCRSGGVIGVGITLFGSQRNQIHANETCGSEGVVLVESHQNRIEGNQISFGEELDGIVLRRSDENEVIDNRVGGQRTGILLEQADHNLVKRNHSSGHEDAIALYESHDNRVIANQAGNADDSSIELVGSDRNLIAQNESPTGEAIGYFVWRSHHNRIRSNLIGSHFFENIVLRDSDHNELRENTVVGALQTRLGCPAWSKPGIRIERGRGNLLRKNALVEHCGDGILVEATSRDTRLLRNLAAGNRDDGLDVEDPRALLVGNTALGNGDYGIEAVPGVRGGRNRALGNENPAQCLEIACR